MPRPLPALVALLTALLAVGCGQRGASLPETHPVRGKVTFKGGGALAGGMVEFRSEDDPGLLTSGEVQPDGTYVLVTRRDGQRSAGAPAGTYRVTVIPPMGADQAAEPVALPAPYTVRPGDNEINLTIDKPRRKP